MRQTDRGQKGGVRRIGQSFCIACSMYSRLPVPTVEWRPENLALALCFFPVVGLVIGAAELAWWCLAVRLQAGAFLTGAVGALLPILITGGIHMDGFMDTQDARSSYGDREKKLAILKDSHLGAFAVIRFGGYLLLYAGLYAELREWRQVCLLALSYVASRCLSAVSFVSCVSAKKSGLFYEFASAARKPAVLGVCGALLALCGMAGIFLSPLTAAGMALVSALVFFYYRRVSYREFGGITGDLAGYFLQLCELWLLAVIVSGGWLSFI